LRGFPALDAYALEIREFFRKLDRIAVEKVAG
jgi:hypothetical protein